MEKESMRVYSGVLEAMEKLTSEAAVLAEHSKRIREYNMTLKTLNTSFDQVQSRLVRVAATKPDLCKTLL